MFPLVTQVIIMIPLIIIESTFWGRSCDKLTDQSATNCIDDSYMLLADKAFAIVVPCSQFVFLFVFLVEENIGPKFDNWY